MSLEALVNAKKIKYSVLDQILRPKIPSNVTNINFIIDLDDLLRTFYNPKVIERFNNVDVDTKLMLSSEILNIVGHYRHYLYSRMRIYSTFFLYRSSEVDYYKVGLNENYKKTYYSKYLKPTVPIFINMRDIIDDNLRLMKVISEYIPYVYYIETGSTEPHVVPYLIQNEISPQYDESSNNVSQNIIVSTSADVYQTLLGSSDENSYILSIRGDNSKLYSKEDITPRLLKGTKSSVDNHLIPDFYPLILSVSGFKKYDISGLKLHGPMRTIKYLNELLESEILYNIYYSEIEVLNEALKATKLTNDNRDKIINNYKLLNYRMNYRDLRQSQKANIELQIIDNIDFESLKFLNDNFYKKHPLIFEFLLEGEGY